MSRYLIDTSILIDANNHYYRSDICPGFWDFLRKQIKVKTVLLIDKVREEVADGEDDLSNWITTKIPLHFFIKTQNDDEIKNHRSDIREYLYAIYKEQQQKQKEGKPPRTESKIEDFLSKADSWLIACALKYQDTTVITGERFVKDNPYAIKIPNVCEHFKVEYQTGIFGTLEKLGARFVLDPRQTAHT